MVLQARQLAELTKLPRRAAYISSIISLWVLACITITVSWMSAFDARALGFFSAPAISIALWTIALTSAGIAVLFLFRAAGVREAPVLHELLPQTASDRALFAVLSVSAGVCEEIAFRGFLLHALHAATGSGALALVLSSGAFAVVHAYQQPLGALRAGLLGTILAAPLLLGQPIYAPILAHAAIDLLSGLWLARHLLR
jgi:membrane protease YdiL (CAAX protease family)